MMLQLQQWTETDAKMLKSYYFICFSFLLVLTEHARCQSDYSFNFKAGAWLKLHTAPEAWEEALLKCQHEGAVLASPLKKELSDAFQLQMLQFGVNSNIFLGTHDLFCKGHFVSVEGVPLSDMDIKWGAQGNGADTGHCLTMSVDGSVHYSSCTDPLPFICYRKPDNEINECGTYDNEYHLNEQTGSCYKVHLDKQTWPRAYSTCASEGGYLVILNDEEEVRIVTNMIHISYDGFNVGLVAWGKERIWNTIHGDKLEDVYNKWSPGEPNNFRNRTEIRGVCLYYGKLNDFPEDMYPLIFVCEKSPQF